jgi:hypothetical protein
MSSVMKRFIKGLVLRGLTDESDIASKDGAGALFYNKTDARIKTYIESSIREILTNSQSQVLTNKTIDYNNNTLLNIPGLQTNVDIINTTVTLGSSASTATGLLYYKATHNMNLTAVYAQLFEKNGISSGTLEVDVKKGTTPDATYIADTLIENFESGSFATNSWTVVNGTQTNKFFVGGAVYDSGTKSAYISNDNGVSNKYTNNAASVVWFYKDIAIPQGALNLKFRYRLYGEFTVDCGKVIIDPSAAIVPVAGTDITTAPINGNYTVLSNTLNTWTDKSIDISSYAGTTVRVIFGWKNDFAIGNNDPIAIDNINLEVEYPAYTTVCSVKPSFNFSTAVDYAVSNGTLSTTSISTGNYLRLDLTSIPSGFAGHIQILLTGVITP